MEADIEFGKLELPLGDATDERWTVEEMMSVRTGHPVSDHEVAIDLPGETVTIRHGVVDLAAAATGALLAVAFARSAAPGLWSMDDVYGAAVRDG